MVGRVNVNSLCCVKRHADMRLNLFIMMQDHRTDKRGWTSVEVVSWLRCFLGHAVCKWTSWHDRRCPLLKTSSSECEQCHGPIILSQTHNHWLKAATTVPLTFTKRLRDNERDRKSTRETGGRLGSLRFMAWQIRSIPPLQAVGHCCRDTLLIC